MKKLILVLTLLVVLAIGVNPTKASSSGDISLDILGDDLGYEKVVLSGNSSTRTLSFPIYKGLTPKELTFRLDYTPNIYNAFIEVESKDRRLQNIFLPLNEDTVTIPLDGIAIEDGIINISFSLFIEDDQSVCSNNEDQILDLSDFTLSTEGSPVKVDTIKDFFQPTVKKLYLFLGENPTSQKVSAALKLTSYLQTVVNGRVVKVATFFEDFDESNTIADEPDKLVINFTDGSDLAEVASLNTGLNFLNLRSQDWDDLVNVLIDSKSKELLNVSKIEHPSYSTPDRDISNVIKLGDVVGDNLILKGVGELPIQIPFTHSDFGGVVTGLHIDINGTISKIPPEGIANVDLFFNDLLVGSYSVNNDGNSVNVKADIEEIVIPRDSELRIVLNYTPPAGHCVVGIHDVTLSLDPDLSIIKADVEQVSRGTSFGNYPQVLIDRFQIAVNNLNAVNVSAAIKLAANMQRLTDTQLFPEIVEYSSLQKDEVADVYIGIAEQFSLSDTKFDLKKSQISFYEGSFENSDKLVSMFTFYASGVDVLMLEQRNWDDGIVRLLSNLEEDDSWYGTSGNIALMGENEEIVYVDDPEFRDDSFTTKFIKFIQNNSVLVTFFVVITIASSVVIFVIRRNPDLIAE